MVAVPLPQSLVPMQPTLGKPFHRPGWIYEEKYDGWRMLAFKDGRRVRLVGRQAVDHTERFRELADAIAALKAPTLILDGEVAVFDKGLVSQFHLLDRLTDEECTPPVFMAFDCLHIHGLDVRGCRCTAAGTCSNRRWRARTWSTPRAGCPTTGSRPGVS
jgi:bifunctional non-homologous end joining protein LigD